MKIILCLHHFLPEFVGGTEIYVANLARQFLQAGIEVVVVIPNLGIDAAEEYFYEGIRVIKYAENSIEDRPMILGKKKPCGLEIFSQIVKKEKPDLVHFHELAPGRGINIFHVEEIRKLKIPLVITFHVPFYTCLRGSLLYRGQQKCDGEIIIKRCSACMYQQKNINGIKAFILNSLAMGLFNLNIDSTSLNSSAGTALGFPFVIDKMKKDLIRLSFLAEKIVVIANWYQQVLKRNSVPDNKLVFIKQGLPNQEIRRVNKSPFAVPLRVIYIGRITPLKGLHLLIDSVLKIPSDKVELDIYGSEKDTTYVNECKGKTRFNRNIKWKGLVSSLEVISTLSSYDILCVPSSFEMSPLVIQEAFAAGTPVIASNVYGNAEHIREGENGWLFDLSDENDLRNKLENLIARPELVNNARKRITPVNSFDKVGKEHVEVYNSICRNYQRN